MVAMNTADANPAHALGRWGEDQAARYLVRRGWRILARNYRFGRREVDLVVRKGRIVAFVEVKTRAGTGFGSPQEAITRLKRREIEAVATQFLACHRLFDAEVRFDAVGIVLDRDRRTLHVDHVPDAWRPGWM
jgi:putative endonuclease